jgi:hypothetical protein
MPLEAAGGKRNATSRPAELENFAQSARQKADEPLRLGSRSTAK